MKGNNFKRCVHKKEKSCLISLHDCRITKVDENQDALLIYFDDGFWLLPDTVYNRENDPIRTGNALLCLNNAQVESLAIYRDSYLNKLFHTGGIRGQKYVLDNEKLTEVVNYKKYQLEIVDEYYYNSDLLFSGCMLKKNNYTKNGFVLSIRYDSWTYMWNDCDEIIRW